MKISIITPSYNQGYFIERTIKSVLNQTLPCNEYIVVDGNSTDNTKNLLQRYAERLTFISEPDEGQTQAINKGIRLSSGDIIGWLNSDDIYYPNAIKTAYDFFSKHPEIDILYGQAYYIDEKDKVIMRYPTQEYCFSALKNFCYICQPAVFFRRLVFERWGLLDETLHYCMDYEYWIRLSKAKVKFAYVKTVLAGSRIHAAAKTSSKSVEMQKEVLSMLNKQLHTIPLRWFLTYAYNVVKTKKSIKKSSHFFIAAFSIFIIAARECIRWNSPLKGCLLIFFLPITALKEIYKKAKKRNKLY